MDCDGTPEEASVEATWHQQADAQVARTWARKLTELFEEFMEHQDFTEVSNSSNCPIRRIDPTTPYG